MALPDDQYQWKSDCYRDIVRRTKEIAQVIPEHWNIELGEDEYRVILGFTTMNWLDPEPGNDRPEKLDPKLKSGLIGKINGRELRLNPEAISRLLPAPPSLQEVAA